jgi:hypothetical protein
MYDEVREAVDSGAVMLEWDYSKGQPTVPLVKDTYASERRKVREREREGGRKQTHTHIHTYTHTHTHTHTHIYIALLTTPPLTTTHTLKAKTLNFSIAYGKTVHGLAQDWAIR